MEKQRECLWDNLKWFLMLCVVLGHFIDQYKAHSDVYKSLFLIIYSFHMPLFIYISGMFHKNNRIVQRVCSYLAIAMLVKIFTFTIGKVMNQDPTFQIFTAAALPWFMIIMAEFTLAVYLLKDVDPRLVMGMAILLAFYSGFDKSLSDFLCIRRFFVFFPVYYLGTLTDRQKLVKLKEKKSLKIASVIILLVWVAACMLMESKLYFLRPFFTGRVKYYSLSSANMGPLYRLEAYLVTALVSFALIMLTPTGKIPLVSTWGQRTLQIYFWHRHFIQVLEIIGIPAVICSTVPGKIVWLVMGAVLAVVLSLKIFEFPTKQITATVRYVSKDKKAS